MARSRKKTVQQKIVGVATVGLPQPARRLLSGRVISSLVVLVIPILFATGVVQVTWSNGRPRFHFNRQAAERLKEEAGNEIQQLRDERPMMAGQGWGQRPNIGNASPQWPAPQQQQPPQYGAPTAPQPPWNASQPAPGNARYGWQTPPNAPPNQVYR